jgi:glycosyltransferase involved in cell wall biosynthesis
MMAEMAPEISVVIPSHDRPLRLRWMLNALEQQTLDRSRWEVIVGHDSEGPETEELLRSHPLAADGTLRHVTLPAGSAPPGRNRNAAWRIARSDTIVFTDDDCRAPEDWLEQALAAAKRHPGAIVQGRTLKDPKEAAIVHAPRIHSQMINPPTPWAEACNIIYPREVLERAGGFDEVHYVGEDTDLALRARKAGAEYVGAPEMLTYHAVIELSLRQKLRTHWRWHDLPHLIVSHPELRRAFPMWMFWKRTHVWAPFFVAGLALMKRNQAYGVLCVPWLAHATPTHGTNPRGRYREVAELPSRLLIDGVEMVALARGSIRYRTLFL